MSKAITVGHAALLGSTFNSVPSPGVAVEALPSDLCETLHPRISLLGGTQPIIIGSDPGKQEILRSLETGSFTTQLAMKTQYWYFGSMIASGTKL